MHERRECLFPTTSSTADFKSRLGHRDFWQCYVRMKTFLVLFWITLTPAVQGQYYVLTATSQSASPTEPSQTKPTLSASLLEPMPLTAIHQTPQPSKTEMTCGITKTHESDLNPAQALAPGPAINPLPISTKQAVTKNMNRTRI